CYCNCTVNPLILSPARSGAFSLETAPRFPSNHYGTSRLLVRHGRREKTRYDTLLLSTATCSQKKRNPAADATLSGLSTQGVLDHAQPSPFCHHSFGASPDPRATP